MKRSVMLFPAIIVILISMFFSACGSSESGGDSTGPGAVKMISVAESSGQIVLTWTDPTDADFASVDVTWQNSSMPDAMGDNIAAGTQTYTLSGLETMASEYTITLTAIDNSGNKSSPVSFKVNYTATATTYHFIYTAAEFNDVRLNLSDSYFLMADINISDYCASSIGWTPISQASGSAFTGAFYGNGHEISGLFLDSGSIYKGLFGYVTGTIKDLGVTGSVAGYNYTGGLAGYNSGTISNCHADVTVSISTAGSSKSSSSYYYFGGLVGFNIGNITNCYATGSVTGDGYTGGLVGYNLGGTISGSYSTGAVTGGNLNYIGGLIGYNSALTGTATISNCHATGNVTTTSNNYVGGLVGYNWESTEGSAKIESCYATGSVSGSGQNYGGLVGTNESAEINLCYSKGNVSGGQYVGGLAGQNSGTISKCYYYCYTVVPDYSVTGTTSSIGGFVGWNSGTISDSFSACKVSVTSTVSNIAGFAGYNNTGTITNSYSSGGVNAGISTNKGGFVGYNNPGSFTSCYYDKNKINLGGDPTGVTGLTTSEMSIQGNYDGWDFDATWTMEFNSYPHLTDLPDPYTSGGK